MNLFTVDPEKCTACGDCLDECPFRLLEIKNGDSLPTPRVIEVRSAEERCINCGHCVAVCPTGALTLHARPHGYAGFSPPPGFPERQSPEDCPLIRPELKVSPERIGHHLMSRRTHRAYRDKQVPRETLEEIIRVASYAPSGHNRQLAKWLVISDKDKIRSHGQTVIDFMRANTQVNPDLPFAWDYTGTDSDVIVDLWEKGEDSVFRGAPHLLVLYGNAGMEAFYARRAQFAIRLAYLELAAASHGLGTVWAGFFVAALELWPPAGKALGLPDGQKAYDAMCVGYPKNQYRRIPLRNEPQIVWE